MITDEYFKDKIPKFHCNIIIDEHKKLLAENDRLKVEGEEREIFSVDGELENHRVELGFEEEKSLSTSKVDLMVHGLSTKDNTL